jgi:hypothetical protein
MLEARLILVRMLFEYKWQVVNTKVDWEAECIHKTTWKMPDLYVRFPTRESESI